jgi:transcriptional regulator with XRE-family HTH domain
MAVRRHTTYQFGDKFKRVRERQQITLTKLASNIGVSASLLSQIENNRISPSVDTLMAIADELEIDPNYLFQEVKQPRKVTIIRRDERNTLKRDGVLYEQLSFPNWGDTQPPFEAFELTLEPGGQKGSEQFGHPGQEMGLLIAGEASLQYGNSEYSLSQGDSISFASRVPHILKNTGDTELKAIWIISPPRMTIDKE